MKSSCWIAAGLAWILAGPLQSQSTGPVHVEIGFGLGPLNRTHRYRAALERIRADGFRVVRVYEPFLKGDAGRIDAVLTNLRIIDSLGLIPYFDLSNFPHQLAGTRGPPLAVRSAMRNGVFSYSNRYPPSSAALDSLMRELIVRLDRTFGRERLRRWYFEFGNEPDADLYFWGSAEDFRRLWEIVRGRYLAYDSTLHLGGGAFTSALAMRGADKDPAFARLARDLAADTTTFVSFHLYAGLRPGRDYGPRINRVLGEPRRTRVISEWNVSTDATERTAAVLGSADAIGPYLVDLLAGAAEAGVGMVLVHKLMDEPKRSQLGLFDSRGQPKAAYGLLRRAAAFARAGFTVMHSGDGSVRLEGAEEIWIVSGSNPISLDSREYEILAPAGAPLTVPPDSWAVLRRRKTAGGVG